MLKGSILYHKILEILWVTAIIGLPLTSFPFIIKLTHSMVAPFSAAPAALLALLWLIPYLLQNGKLPLETGLLFLFLLVSIAAAAGAFFIDIPTYRSKTIFSQEIEAFITLGLGLIFYLVFAAWPNTTRRLQQTLRWVSVGGFLHLVWCLTQIHLIITKASSHPAWVLKIQSILVFQPENIFSGFPRVTGLTFEPSWFAHQMVLIYLPVWFAATLTRQSSFRKLVLGISIENILLVWGMISFLLSSPRISLLGLFLGLVFLVGKFTLWLIHRFTELVIKHWLKDSRKSVRLLRTAIGTAIGVLILVLFLSSAFGLIVLTSQYDYRMALLLKQPPTLKDITGVLTIDEDILLRFGLHNFFLERTAYWITGMRVFENFPLFGVGLGNTGFFGMDKMPILGWSSYEIRTLFYRQDGLMNTKSLWVRLLSETGLVGFSIFGIWLYFHWRSASLMSKDRNSLLRWIGMAGQFCFLALIAEGFSIDSFALPYLWFGTGLVAAAGLVYRQHKL
jgi:hypothetical protein